MFLIFGANRAGEFFGFAKMVEPIDKIKAAARAIRDLSSSSKLSQHSSSGSGSGSGSGSHSSGKEQPGHAPGPSKLKSATQPGRIKEEIEEEDLGRRGSEPIRPTFLLSPQNSHLASSSPGQLTPADEMSQDASAEQTEHAAGERHTDPPKALIAEEAESGPHQRAQTLDPRDLAGSSYFPAPPVPITVAQAAEDEAEKQMERGGSHRPPEVDEDGVKRKDTALTPGEKATRTGVEPEEFEPDAWGERFKIEWIRVGNLPFGRTKHLRNPWNADREVKISRDGTELEPSPLNSSSCNWLMGQTSETISWRNGTELTFTIPVSPTSHTHNH